jgi:hypothetical protein
VRCRDVQELLAISSGTRTHTLTESVQSHIRACKDCHDLARILELPSGDVQMNSLPIDAIRKIVVDELRPVRPLLPSWAFFLAFALIFTGLSVLGGFYLGTHGWFLLMPGQKIAIFATLAASAALLSFSLVRQMVPGEKLLLRPELLPIALFVLLCLVVASVFQPRADSHFLQDGEKCLKIGVSYAIPAALAFWFILSRGAILSPRVVGAVAGMLAGLVSTTVLEVHCPNLDLWHILVWHVGIAFLGTIAGLLVAVAGQAIRNRVS